MLYLRFCSNCFMSLVYTLMENDYKLGFLERASSLDAVTNSLTTISGLAKSIVNNPSDAKSVYELCKKMAYVSDHYNDEKIRSIARSLKEYMFLFIGYNTVLSLCNTSQPKCEEDSLSLNELLEKLEKLVGLKNVKTTVKDLISFNKIQQIRKQNGLRTIKRTLHLSFTGNPGTGKTTVARIIGRIYKHLGLLSKGHFIEVSRTDLIAGYQGQTAIKVKDVINKARGGVLFIDEAYSITENENSDSYGRECLTELTKALEDYRDDLMVIVAGYTEPMNVFFESNPGLKSRFNTFIEFDDYNNDELFEIFNSIIIDNEYELGHGTDVLIKNILSEKMFSDNEKPSNGRFVRNLYEKIVMNQSRRLSLQNALSIADLKTICPEDI